MFSTIAPPPTTSTQPSTQPARNPWRVIGGAGMIAAPLLLTGGALTSPNAKSDSTKDYVASLAEDPTMSSISAHLYHYSWVALVFGAIAAVGLAAGRGRVLTLIGSIVTILGAVQISGLLLSDFFNSEAAQLLGAGRAAEVFDQVNKDPGVAIWFITGAALVLAGPVVLLLGLARAGRTPWWLPVLTLVGFVTPFFLEGTLGLVVGGIGAVPLLWVGVVLLRNGRPTA